MKKNAKYDPTAMASALNVKTKQKIRINHSLKKTFIEITKKYHKYIILTDYKAVKE